PSTTLLPYTTLFRSKRINRNVTTDYTKPFTYSVPLGNNEGQNNILWYTKMRDESIEYLKTTNDNLRLYRVNFQPNIHQHYMMFLDRKSTRLNSSHVK